MARAVSAYIVSRTSNSPVNRRNTRHSLHFGGAAARCRFVGQAPKNRGRFRVRLASLVAASCPPSLSRKGKKEATSRIATAQARSSIDLQSLWTLDFRSSNHQDLVELLETGLRMMIPLIQFGLSH